MAERYNYMQAMKEDIKDYIESEINISDFDDLEELESYLNDELFNCDSVTGNASGSYTFCRATAQKYVEQNKELVKKMAEEFGCEDQVCNWWYEDNYEAIDVSICCYLLGVAISEIIEEMEA